MIAIQHRVGFKPYPVLFHTQIYIGLQNSRDGPVVVTTGKPVPALYNLYLSYII